MSFAYPLFLLAGLTLAIPVLIHLFNLRRYKTVLFPNTRLLRNIQISSQKQSQIRYKWLLALRLLFLLSLILAFAQPFFRQNTKAASDRLQIIYLDNSGSMSVKKGARDLFEIARDAARQQLRHAAPSQKFLILSNDRPLSWQPVSPEKALTLVDQLDISATAGRAEDVFASIQGLLQSQGTAAADVYFYSDFQENTFPARAEASLLKGIELHAIPVSASGAGNVFIDTAYFSNPVIQTGQNNQLIVRSRLEGETPAAAPVLQLSINGQVKTAASLNFGDESESTDTLGFQVNDPAWQRLTLTIADALRFDDTFRITTRSAANLTVLVLNQQSANPYIQAAARAYSGFRMEHQTLPSDKDWSAYNLIILQGIIALNEAMVSKVQAALQRGQSIFIIPGRTQDIQTINQGLGRIADLQITSVDTAGQSVTSLQQGSELVRDLFERIPDNVQLPYAKWHYVVKAGLSANQQAILSFRDGAPLLAQYSLYRGKLYLLTSSADIQAGNFAASYFFVPFLYQMTARAKGDDVFAITAGKPYGTYLPLSNVDDRNVVHAYGPGTDIIPPQRPAGSGVELFLGQVLRQPGFYDLVIAGDTIPVALNQDRTESYLRPWELNALKKGWSGANIHWLSLEDVTGRGSGSAAAAFPLWKVCAILALLMLAAESYVLAAGHKKQTVPSR